MSKRKDTKKLARMFLGAVGPDGAEAALGELKTIEALIRKSSDFASLMASPVFTDEERSGAIEAVGGKLGLSVHTVKFIQYLCTIGAAGALSEILAKGITLFLESNGRVQATVITPYALGVEYDARLKASLKRITSKDVELKYETDPSLIGGLLVKVGSTMYDGTVRGQLRLLRDELIRG